MNKATERVLDHCMQKPLVRYAAGLATDVFGYDGRRSKPAMDAQELFEYLQSLPEAERRGMEVTCTADGTTPSLWPTSAYTAYAETAGILMHLSEAPTAEAERVLCLKE